MSRVQLKIALREITAKAAAFQHFHDNETFMKLSLTLHQLLNCTHQFEILQHIYCDD